MANDSRLSASRSRNKVKKHMQCDNCNKQNDSLLVNYVSQRRVFFFSSLNYFITRNAAKRKTSRILLLLSSFFLIAQVSALTVIYLTKKKTRWKCEKAHHTQFIHAHKKTKNWHKRMQRTKKKFNERLPLLFISHSKWHFICMQLFVWLT